jgi:hypothetical protein
MSDRYYKIDGFVPYGKVPYANFCRYRYATAPARSQHTASPLPPIWYGVVELLSPTKWDGSVRPPQHGDCTPEVVIYRADGAEWRGTIGTEDLARQCVNSYVSGGKTPGIFGWGRIGGSRLLLRSLTPSTDELVAVAHDISAREDLGIEPTDLGSAEEVFTALFDAGNQTPHLRLYLHCVEIRRRAEHIAGRVGCTV